MMRDNSKKKLTLLFLIGIIFIACFDTWIGASISKAPFSHTPTTHSSGRQGQNYIFFYQRSFSSSIYVVAWSPVGTRIASASADGTMQNSGIHSMEVVFLPPLITPGLSIALHVHMPLTPKISLDNENRGIRIWNASRRRLYQLRVASFIDHPGNITAAYASIEKALHIKQVEIFVDLVDRYNESLVNEFSQRFLANAHRGRVWVHKELNDEQLKQLSALSDGTQEGFK